MIRTAIAAPVDPLAAIIAASRIIPTTAAIKAMDSADGARAARAWALRCCMVNRGGVREESLPPVASRFLLVLTLRASPTAPPVTRSGQAAGCGGHRMLIRVRAIDTDRSLRDVSPPRSLPRARFVSDTA